MNRKRGKSAYADFSLFLIHDNRNHATRGNNEDFSWIIGKMELYNGKKYDILCGMR